MRVDDHPHQPLTSGSRGRCQSSRNIGCIARGQGAVAVTDEAIEKIKAMITSGAARRRPAPQGGGPGRRPRALPRLAARGGPRAGPGQHPRRAPWRRNLRDEPGAARLARGANFIVDFHRDDTVLEFLEVRRILEPGRHRHGSGADQPRRSQGPAGAAGQPGVEPDPEELVEKDMTSTAGSWSSAGSSVLASLLASMSGPTTRLGVARGSPRPGPDTNVRRAPSDPRRAHRAPRPRGPGRRCISPGRAVARAVRKAWRGARTRAVADGNLRRAFGLPGVSAPACVDEPGTGIGVSPATRPPTGASRAVDPRR